MTREGLIAYDRWLTENKWGSSEIITPEQAADLYLAKHSLPPAEGAEEILNKAKAGGIPLTWLITPGYPAWNAILDAMQEFAAQPQPTAEGAETIKQALCDDIEKSLNSAKMKHILSEDGEVLPFVDFMSTGDTIAEGREEIENIVEQIYFDMDSWPSLAALHAQRIAEKMVEERLRGELLKYSEWWDKEYSPMRLDFHRERDVDQYLKEKKR